MRKMFSAALCVVLIAGLSGIALARNTDGTDVRIQVTVSPTVTVVPLVPTVIGDPIQPGHDVSAVRVGFRVDSNSQWLWLSAAASDLFKGDVPNSTNRLVRRAGVPVECPAGSPDYGATAGGVTPILQYGASTVTINGFTAYLTNAIRFESNQNNRFSMPCYVTFTWEGVTGFNGPETPVGDYSGYVRFTSTIVL